MSKVLLISILCLIKCTWCGNYGFGLGRRHSNDEMLHHELLTNNGESNENIIEYTYIAEKPVSYIQLRTNTNIYTEVTFFNSYIIHIKLSNFEPMEFNATLAVYGFPLHPGGPEPDPVQLLLQPNPRKAAYLNKSSIEDNGIIATNGAHAGKEKSIKYRNGAVENVNANSRLEYYDYDSTINENTEVARGVDLVANIEAKNESVAIRLHFFVVIAVSFITMCIR